MARTLTMDTIDFATYERSTEAQAKIKPASIYTDEVKAEFALRDKPDPNPTILSKLKGLIHFRPGEVTAWAGYNGHKKSMYLGQICLNLCQQGRRSLIISVEMKPFRTLARMARQVTASRWPSPSSVDAVSEWTDDKLWLFDHIGRLSPAQCIAACRYFAEELKGEHVIIDSMMMICASEESLDEQKQFVTDLCRVAQETGLHVHAVVHCRKPQSGEDTPPSKYDIRGSAAISDQIGNVITVWSNKAKEKALQKDQNDESWREKPDILITVEKQRNGSWEGRAQMWFHGDSLRFCDDRISAVIPMNTTTEWSPA